VQFAASPASEQSAHHTANQSTRAAAAMMASATAVGRTAVIGFVAAAGVRH
jgi:hypothetical protein